MSEKVNSPIPVLFTPIENIAIETPYESEEDGRLNKCRSCVVKDVYAWLAVNEGCRSKEYKKSKAKDPIEYRAKSAARTSKRRRTVKNAQPLWANQQ